MKTKKCFKCNDEKPLREFYKHPRMADGYLNKCKECAKTDVQLNYIKNHDYYVQYEISRRDNPKRLKARRDHSRWIRKNDPERNKLYQSGYPKEKRKAANAVSSALRSGKIIKKPCIKCGNKKVQGHHYDYNKPLDVIWLCKKHHSEIHRKHIEAIK